MVLKTNIYTGLFNSLKVVQFLIYVRSYGKTYGTYILEPTYISNKQYLV